MRILQVMAGAPQGGAETAFVDLCLAFRARGIDQQVATRPNNLRVPQLETAGLSVHKLPFGGALDVYTPWRLRRIIDDYKPHIVQTWMARASKHAPASPSPKKFLKFSRLGGYYDIKYFRTTDYFTTITPDIKSYLIKEGVPEDRIRQINNFAEMEPDPVPVSRASLTTPDEAFVLLSLSRLHKSKAIDTLLDAVSRVPGAYLWIAGDGPDRAALEKKCADLKLNDRVRFLGWRDDRAGLLASCDACVFPSRYEPFGTVFVQAWAARRPLICTMADGPRQFVRNREDGLMVPVDDVAALAAAMAELRGDATLAGNLVEHGYARYQEEFTVDKTVDRYLEFYAEAVRREGIPAV